MTISVALASDHGGFELKQKIIAYFDRELKNELGLDWEDFGTNNLDSVDYPAFGKLIGEKVKNREFDFGIIICSTGIGISISANRIKGVRAALCHDVTTARLTREHNDANVLALGGLILGDKLAFDIVKTFLTTEFSKNPRHQRRIEEIENSDQFC